MRMSPLGVAGSDQCSTTLRSVLSIISYTTFPGMSSAPAAGKNTAKCLSLCSKRKVSVCEGHSPTCRFGPGEDEGAGAAAAHHLVAGVEVDAVDGKGPQQRDLHGLGRHLVLCKGKFPDGRNAFRAIVPQAEVPAAALVKKGAVGETKHVSPSSIRRPGKRQNPFRFEHCKDL